MKILILLLIILSVDDVFAQGNDRMATYIKGEIFEKPSINDSIIFNSGIIPPRYFEKPRLSASIINNHFIIKNDLSYPQMFRSVFTSDKNIRAWRNGKFFLEPSTNTVTTNYLFENCNVVNGVAGSEYINVFIPFFLKSEPYNCKSETLNNLGQSGSTEYDSTLFKYVKRYPDSYVALWALIERFTFFGQSEVRQETLNMFSNKIKREPLWNIIENDFEKSPIKENEKFPNIQLQTYEFKKTNLELPIAKYILVDYWFSRCKPCLEELPALKSLYAKYKSKGFEIVSISTDQTKDLAIWQKRIKEFELNWPQYLDENGSEAIRLSVNIFPTTFLLNQKGEVIMKNISAQNLEIFLEKKSAN
jgi:thiol-disulfide isomerase/thioredoxin